MKEERCERCGNIIGLGCPCSPGKSTPKAGTPPTGPHEWHGFGPDTIFIHHRRLAHLPGACGHLSETDVTEDNRKWGWIRNPDPGAWRRLSESSPLAATEGNTDLVATGRCKHCDDSVR
jgi:hypothetical protein